MYGSVLWDLSFPDIELVCSQWRKGERRVWGLLPDAHIRLLHVLSGKLPVLDELAKRTALFAQQCMCSDSPLVSFISRHAVLFAKMNSPLGRNIIFCCTRYCVAVDDFLSINSVFILHRVFDLVDHNTWICGKVLLELIAANTSRFYFSLSDFDNCEISAFVSCLSTM